MSRHAVCHPAQAIPSAAGDAPERVVLTNAGGHLHIAEPLAVSAQ